MKRILTVWREVGGRRGCIDVVVMIGGGIVFNRKGWLGLVALSGWDTRPRRCRYQTSYHGRKKSIEWEKSTSLNILSAPCHIYCHLLPRTLVNPPSPANESFSHHKM